MQAEDSIGNWWAINWKSRHATHQDCVAVAAAFERGEVLASDAGSVELPRQVSACRFVGRDHKGRLVQPRVGRFFPPGFLSVPGIARPFRVLAMAGDTLSIDASPPLAGRDLTTCLLPRHAGDVLKRAGAISDPFASVIRAGVGFQAAMASGDTDFGLDRRFARADEGSDADFYATPRMVHHLDATSRAVLTERHSQLLGDLPMAAPVLDLMSSRHTHLGAPNRFELTGLGLNAQELAANPALVAHVVHDLNRDRLLPFSDGAFTGALCSLSVEYLVEPLAIFAEVARVLQPGAPFVVAWTERWFPPKAIDLWAELHPYERVAMVVDCFRLAGGWTDIATESWRGLSRPADDRYGDRLPEADPLFLVYARRTA